MEPKTRKSARAIIQTFALETEKLAWDLLNLTWGDDRGMRNQFLAYIERLNTLNQISKKMEWHKLNFRFQKNVDQLFATYLKHKSGGMG